MTIRQHLLLLGFGVVVLILYLGHNVALSRHEVFVAQSAREMLAGAPWSVQSFGGEFRLQKPPGASWIVASSMALFRTREEWFVRLPMALMGIAIAWSTATTFARFLGARVGLLTGLLILCTFWIQKQARMAEADIALTFCVTGAMCLFAIDVLDPAGPRRWRRIGFFALLTASVLVKAIGPLVVLPACALYYHRTRNARAKAFFTDWVGWIILVLPVALWVCLALKTAPDIATTWKHETLDRAAGEHDRPITLARYAAEFFYFAWWIPILLLPTTPSVVLGVMRGLPIAHPQRRREVGELLLCWVLPWLLLMTVSAWKHFHYIMPILPALGVYAGVGMDCWMRARRSPGMAVGLAVALFACTAMALVSIQKSLVPLTDGYHFGRDFAAQVNHLVPDRQPVYLAGIGQASIAYYVDRPVRRIDDSEAFPRKIAGETAYALTTPTFLPDLAKDFIVEPLADLAHDKPKNLPADQVDLTLVRLTRRG